MSYDDCFWKLPVIETPRLILRQITDNLRDGQDCLEFINDFKVIRYWGLYDEQADQDGTLKPQEITDLSFPYQSTMSEYRSGNELSWLMELKENHKVIGEIVLYDFKLKKQADIGYRINSNYWGKGFASEAGQAILKVAFDIMQLKRLQIRCFSVNKGSLQVAKKLGFRLEGEIKQGAILNVMTDYYILGYLDEEYKKTADSNRL